MKRLLASLLLLAAGLGGITPILVCQEPDTYSLRRAGCSTKPGFDNSACIAKALNIGVSTGAAVLCGNGAGTKEPAVYSYSSAISIRLTKPLRFYGTGPNGCILNYIGTGSATAPGIKWYTVFGSGDLSSGSEISNVQFWSCTQLLALLQLDFLGQSHLTNVVFRPADTGCADGSGGYTASATLSPKPKNMLLARSWQSGASASKLMVYKWAERGVGVESLSESCCGYWASHTGHTTSAVSASGGTFTVDDCTDWDANGFNTLIFANGTHVQLSGCSGSPGTATIRADCNIGTGVSGTSACIGFQQTPVTVSGGNAEASGASYTIGYAVASDIMISSSQIYGDTDALAIGFNAHVVLPDRVYLVGACNGILNNSGEAVVRDVHFEDNSCYDYRQNGGTSGGGDIAGSHFGSVLVAGYGTYESRGARYLCCGGTGIETASTLTYARIMDGFISGSITTVFGSTTNVCNNVNEIGSYYVAANACLQAPITVGKFGNDASAAGIRVRTPAASTWNSGTAYVTGDQVSYSSHNYIAIAGSTNQAPPNAMYWTETFGGGLAASNDGGMTYFPVAGAVNDWVLCASASTGLLILYPGPGCSGTPFATFSSTGLIVPTLNATSGVVAGGTSDLNALKISGQAAARAGHTNFVCMDENKNVLSSGSSCNP